MKLRALLLASALLVPVAGSALADQPQGGMRVAVVDVQRAMMQTEDGLRAQATLKKLFDGTGFLLHKTHAKVITCYLRNAFRLPFSPNR